MIGKLKIKLRKTDGISILHDSRRDVSALAKVCNELIDKTNELIDKVNELDKMLVRTKESEVEKG